MQHISPLSTDATRQSLGEKQARKLRETRGRDIFDSLNNRPAENNIHFTAASNQPNGWYPTLEADSQSMRNYEKDDDTDHER
ncbi:hypothetical protein Tco_0956835, partial [Tanacetum coccineum]